VSCHYIHALDQRVTHDGTKLVCRLVDFMPAEVHDVSQEAFDQTMTADTQERFANAIWG
jgi:hypothetical protein